MRTWVSMVLGAVLATAGSSVGADGFGGYLAGGSNFPDNGRVVPTVLSATPPYRLDGSHDWRLGDTFMFGVEGHLDVGTVHGLTQQNDSNDYGLGLRIGVPLDSLMPYAHFHYEHAHAAGILPGSGNNGTNGGLGLVYKFSPHWRMKGEWSAATPSANGFKFRSNNLNFGVNYRFDSAGERASARY